MKFKLVEAGGEANADFKADSVGFESGDVGLLVDDADREETKFPPLISERNVRRFV